MSDGIRIIRTGLYGQLAHDALLAVFGNDDGETNWDNLSNRNDPRWFKHCYSAIIGRTLLHTFSKTHVKYDVNGEVVVVSRYRSGYYWESSRIAWNNHDDKWCRDWLADKVKAIVKMQYGFETILNATTRANAKWNADNAEDKAFTWVTAVASKTDPYNAGKLVAVPPTESQQAITVADAYALYQALKFGPAKITSEKYRESIVSKPRDPVETELATYRRDEIAKLKESLAAKKAALLTEKNKAVDELSNKCETEIEALRHKWRNDQNAIYARYKPLEDAVDAEFKAKFDAVKREFEEAVKKLDAELTSA